MSASRPSLTTSRLLAAGFNVVGRWELNSADDLAHTIDLPSRSGVYAFAIDGIVQYVGLASGSVKQRLGFYRKPAASQRTNVRLNANIREKLRAGAVVEILISHPPDHNWNGLRIRGPEGLEAGLIECFELPWNMRGSQSQVTAAERRMSDARTGSKGGAANRILELVQRRPGMTELEIAKALFGNSAAQQQVNQYCRALAKSGQLLRRGRGGPSDPYTYHPNRAGSFLGLASSGQPIT